jgi:hypothetical protein
MVETLKEESRRLLAALLAQDGSARLDEIFDARGRALEQVAAEVAGGAALSAESVAELARLDADIGDAIRRRRDELREELVLLQRVRAALSGYVPEGRAFARFIEREA